MFIDFFTICGKPLRLQVGAPLPEPPTRRPPDKPSLVDPSPNFLSRFLIILVIILQFLNNLLEFFGGNFAKKFEK